MSIQNKKLNIVSDTNFDGNKITDAKINAQENSISNLETSNFKSDVIQSVVRDGTYATNTSIPTEKAVSDALDKKQDGLPEQSGSAGRYLTTDGTTVSWGEVNANYLYDTKVLSQAISNKGWAYQCKSVRTDLAKADVPTVYDDIENKFLNCDKVAYTDNYTINGSTVNIQYYKYNDWKICIAGENGTDDINLNTVFDDLGYLNYWRLDRNGQTVTLPRNSNLYTQMFVGDNYDDTEDNLITADWSATALKSELDLIPDQTGNSGKFLTTDGSTLSWAEVQSGTTIRQVDYYELAEVDDTTDITGTIEIDKDTYLGEITDDRVVKSYTYDGSVWKNDSNDTVSLTTLGIDISNATYSLNSSFDVYSVCLRNKTSFTVSRTITAINCLYLNGNLQLKKDYNVTTTEIDGQEFPTIEFNDYILQTTDTLSII